MYAKKLHVAMTKKNLAHSFGILLFVLISLQGKKSENISHPDVDEMTQRNGILTKSNFPNIYILTYDSL